MSLFLDPLLMTIAKLRVCFSPVLMYLQLFLTSSRSFLLDPHHWRSALYIKMSSTRFILLDCIFFFCSLGHLHVSLWVSLYVSDICYFWRSLTEFRIWSSLSDSSPSSFHVPKARKESCQIFSHLLLFFFFFSNTTSNSFCKRALSRLIVCLVVVASLYTSVMFQRNLDFL